jgi:prepilin-type processing-associated H-X9-DG protein
MMPSNNYSSLVQLSAVRNPGETFLIGDSAGYSNSTQYPSGTLTRTIYVPEAYSINQNVPSRPQFHGRHSGAGNALWFDGHVSSEHVAPLNNTKTYFSFSNGTAVTGAMLNKLNLGYLTRPGDDPSKPIANYYFFLDKEGRVLSYNPKVSD